MKNKSYFFKNLYNFNIVTTFFSLWIAVFFSSYIQNWLAYILILSFGILHGANDIKLIQKSIINQRGKYQFWTILLLYIGIVFLGLGFFYIVPALTFSLFIIVSGYHFGEQHWVSKFVHNNLFSSVFFLSYGSFILLILFKLHAEMVLDVVKKITSYQLDPIFFTYALWVCGILFGIQLLIATILKKVQTNFFKELFFLLVFYVVFSTASLMWSFAIYFILWHSLPSIADQIVFLYGYLNKKTIFKYFKSSFVYWLVAALTSGLLLYIFKEDMETSLSFFLYFLAAITFPHVFVISQLNRD